jgi:N-acetyl-anhydromuramyl-L-alanine amidase AmpD
MNIINTHLDHGSKFNDPEIIVIHAMGEYIGGDGWNDHAVQYLDKKKWSAHAFGAPNGDIYRCRLDNEGAYHALDFNTDSLGYEFLVEGSYKYGSFIDRIKEPYLTKLQYESGVEFVSDWVKMYNIKKVVRHSDLSPERKVDPGKGFPWKKFLYDIGM